MQSNGFRLELFRDPAEYEETPLRDRKSHLYDLKDRLEKAEFIRDTISLANSARMWGKPAYLIFGIGDDGSLRNIREELQSYGLPSDRLPKHEQINNAMEKLRHQIKK